MSSIMLLRKQVAIKLSCKLRLTLSSLQFASNFIIINRNQSV